MGKTKVKTIDNEEQPTTNNGQQEAKISSRAAGTSEDTPKAGEGGNKTGHDNIKQRSNKYKEALEKVDRGRNYPLGEALEVVKNSSYSKFGGSLEIHLKLGVKTLRGLASLPFTSGKQVKVLAFGKGAEESGADMTGDDNKISEIEKGKIDFDALVTTPEWMPKLARCAKILGPKGLMPSPKNATITTDLKKAVTELQSGRVEYKTDKEGYSVHLSLGKLSQPNEELLANLKTLLTTIGKSKIKKAVLAPSMGPGVKIESF